MFQLFYNVNINKTRKTNIKQKQEK